MLIFVTFCLIFYFHCCGGCEVKLEIVLTDSANVCRSGDSRALARRACECERLPDQRADSSLSLHASCYTNSQHYGRQQKAQQVVDKATRIKNV